MPVTDQGVNRDRYMLVPRTLVFISQGEKVLLLKGADSKRLWSGLYNGVGGHIEQGEDVLTAAKRELFEETGLTSPDIYLCGVLTVDTQTNPGVGIFIFKGECTACTPALSKEGALQWVELSDIDNLPLVTDLPVLLPIILEHKPGLPPFSAHSMYDEFGKMVIKFA